MGSVSMIMEWLALTLEALCWQELNPWLAWVSIVVNLNMVELFYKSGSVHLTNPLLDRSWWGPRIIL